MYHFLLIYHGRNLAANWESGGAAASMAGRKHVPIWFRSADHLAQ
jgi:hypothetical protein